MISPFNIIWSGYYIAIYIYYYMKLCYIIFNYIKQYIYILWYYYIICVMYQIIYIYVHSTTTHRAKLYWQHLVIKVWDSHCSHGRISKSSRGWWDCLSIWMTIGRDLLMTIPWWEWLLGISFIYLSGFDVDICIHFSWSIWIWHWLKIMRWRWASAAALAKQS